MTTSASRSRLSPLSVISSGSPGPAPTNDTHGAVSWLALRSAPRAERIAPGARARPGSSSHGTSSRIRMPARGSAPPRPPTKTWTPSTILPSTFTLQPWSPTSAVWWLPQLGRTARPAHGDRARARRARASNSRASASARVLVSISARLQKSVPGARGDAALHLGRVVGQLAQQRLLERARRAARRARAGCSTFCSGVVRSSPVPYASASARQLDELVAGHAADRRLEADVVQPRLRWRNTPT